MQLSGRANLSAPPNKNLDEDLGGTGDIVQW